MAEVMVDDKDVTKTRLCASIGKLRAISVSVFNQDLPIVSK